MAEKKKGFLQRLGFGRKADEVEAPAPPPPPPPVKTPPSSETGATTAAERALEEARALARERERLGISAVEQAERLAREREAEDAAAAERKAREAAEAKAAEEKAAAEAAAAETAKREEERRDAEARARAEREAAEAKAEAERLESERLEAERLEAERLDRERAEQKRLAAEREAKREAKREAEAKAAAERAEAERAAKAKAAEEKAAREKAAQEKAAADKAAAEKAAKEKAAADKAAAEAAEAKRLAAEQQAREQAAREAAEREAAEREAKEQARLKAEAEARAEAEAKADIPASPASVPGPRETEPDGRGPGSSPGKRDADKSKADKAAEKAERERLKRERAKANREAAREAKIAAEAEAKREAEARERAEVEEAERLAAEKAEREAREADERERLKAEAKAKVAALKSKPKSRTVEEIQEAEGTVFQRFSRGLKRSSSKLSENVTGAFQKRLLDEAALEDLEDMLIASDLGVKPSLRIVQALEDQRFNTTVDDGEVRDAMAEVVADTLGPFEMPLKMAHMPGSGHLEVVLFTGVNGSGKTTTLGKLAAIFRDAGYTILIAAADTFRAAANEQLAIWAERAEAPILEGKQGADAAGLVFDAMKRAKEDGYDILMVDTAGRLQNRTELMDELQKIVRVIRKQDETAPHHSLLVLDATVGQNALSQVEVFKDTADVTGLVMTKLDGTAKGGVLVNLADTHGLPIHFIGIGERLEDLEVFRAEPFAKALAGAI